MKRCQSLIENMSLRAVGLERPISFDFFSYQKTQHGENDARRPYPLGLGAQDLKSALREKTFHTERRRLDRMKGKEESRVGDWPEQRDAVTAVRERVQQAVREHLHE